MMDLWVTAFSILGLFILRLGIPLAVIFLIGYWLRRLDAKWQAEAVARRETEIELVGEPEIEIYRVIDQPCWVIKDCPESIRNQCPAFQYPDKICWLARRQAEGKIPEACYYCPLFSLKHSPQLSAN
jgi:hypothetical protein